MSQANQGREKEQFSVTWNKTLGKSFLEGEEGIEKDNKK
jgi:hypothetical protein